MIHQSWQDHGHGANFSVTVDRMLGMKLQYSSHQCPEAATKTGIEFEDGDQQTADTTQGEFFGSNAEGAGAESAAQTGSSGGTDQASPSGATPTPPTTPSAAAGGSSDWAVGNSYGVGDVCQYEGQSYQCRQAHTVQAPNWTPPNTLALWLPIGTSEWKQGTTYNTDDRCSYDSQNYRCRQAHTAHAANWTPPNTPNLWMPEQ